MAPTPTVMPLHPLDAHGVHVPVHDYARAVTELPLGDQVRAVAEVAALRADDVHAPVDVIRAVEQGGGGAHLPEDRLEVLLAGGLAGSALVAAVAVARVDPHQLLQSPDDAVTVLIRCGQEAVHGVTPHVGTGSSPRPCGPARAPFAARRQVSSSGGMGRGGGE